MIISSIILCVCLVSPPPAKLLFRFVVIGDTQGGIPKRCRGHYKGCRGHDWNRWVLPAAIKDMNRNRPAFLVHLGDQQSYGGLRFLNLFKKRISPLKIPYKLVIGNHELTKAGRRYRLYRKNGLLWKKFWGYKHTYYTFRYKDYTFIILDNSFSRVSGSQVKWFRSILSSPKNKKVFIFSHRPFSAPAKIYKQKINYYKYRGNVRHRLVGWHTYGRMNPAAYNKNGKLMWRILEGNSHKVLSLFHGHFHSYRFYKVNGIKAICSGGGGGTLQTRYDFHHYLLVSVYDKGIKVRIRFIERGKSAY